MMFDTPFYHSSIKNYIAVFGTLFSNLRIVDTFDNIHIVPLHYAPKEKFITLLQSFIEDTEIDITLPRMAFELIGIEPDIERMTSPLLQIEDSDNKRYMYNRIPYNFLFCLYVTSKKFEDSLKIIEQILPFFTPSFNVLIKDNKNFNISSDVPITMQSVTHNIEYEGDYDNAPRYILWELSFMMEGYIYSNIREAESVKRIISEFQQKDYDTFYKTLVVEVDPYTANVNDDYTIKTQILHERWAKTKYLSPYTQDGHNITFSITF